MTEEQQSPGGTGTEERWERYLDLLGDGLFEAALDGTITYANRAAEMIVGRPRAELVGAHYLDLFAPESRESVEGLFRRAVKGEMLETDLRMAGGLMCHARGGALRGSDGAIIGGFGIVRDITKRWLAEEAYRTLVENSLQSLIVLQDNRCVFTNPAASDLLGYSADELGAMSTEEVQAVVHPEDFEMVWSRYAARMRGDEVEPLYQFRMIRKDGGLRWVEMFATRITYLGRPAAQAVLLDVTKRKIAEEAYRSLVENSLQALVVFQDSKIVYANPATRDVLGIDPEELIEQPDTIISDRVHPEDRDAVWGRYTDRMAGREVPRRNEIRLLQPGGAVRELETFATVIEFGGRPAMQTAMIDVTQRKRREREQRALLAVATALRTGETRNEMLPAMLEQVFTLLEGEGALVALREPGTGGVVAELACGLWESLSGDRLQPGEGMSAELISTGRAFVSDDVTREGRFARPEVLSRTRAIAGAPFIVGDETIGVLWIGRHYEFSDNEVRLLTSIAEMTANALRRATLFEDAGRRVKRLDALHRIDLAITGSADLAVVYQVILDQVQAQLEVDAASILRLDNQTMSLFSAASRGLRSTGTSITGVRLGQGRTGRAALERRLVAVSNVTDAKTPEWSEPRLAGEEVAAHFAAPLVAKGKLFGVLEAIHREVLHPDAEWLDFLQTLAGQAAIAIDGAVNLDELRRSHTDLELAYDTTLEGWSRALELRDRETQGHTQRVAELTVRLARSVGVPEEEIVHVRRGALLHDIGKMGVPDGILLKRGPLSEVEWDVMRRHPEYARQMLWPIDYLRPALDIPFGHHERWDGSGYPHGLAGEAIPLAARIFAVVDVWDALSSDRPYRNAWPAEKVVDYLSENRGIQFDARVVDAFLQILDETAEPASDVTAP